VLPETYKRYVLGTLTCAYSLNLLDRGLIILQLQSIKQDLHLSDTQLGFLTGIAFALFYAVLGVPIARWADRGNRVTITSIAIAIWGLTVSLCLWVTNFAQLVLARVAAGVGEAGCMPPTYSLLGDYFPGSTERTRAVSIYMLAGPLSSLLSFVVGGWLNETLGWRATFFVMGLPALLVAALVKWTIREPRAEAKPETALHAVPGVIEILKTLWQRRSSRHLVAGTVLLFTMGYGLGPWYAAFMMRSHQMHPAELGVWLGLIFGISGIAGILMGGYLGGRRFAGNEPAQMRLSAITVAMLVPCFVMFLLAPGKYEALIVLMPLSVIFNFCLGPAFALLQRLVVDSARATTLAVVMLLTNLIGMGAGPQVVGILSDAFAPIFGGDSLRYAMLLMSLVAFWSAYHFWGVGHTVREDLMAVGEENSHLALVAT